MVTFSRLSDGTWGLRGPSHEVVEGHHVTVERKDGTFVPALVGRVVWTDKKTSLATAERIENERSQAPKKRRPTKAQQRMLDDAHVEIESLDELNDL